MNEPMRTALRALVSCMGTEAKDSDVWEVAEEHGVDAKQLLAQYKRITADLTKWLDGQLLSFPVVWADQGGE